MKIYKSHFILVGVLALFFPSCAVVSHWDEAMALKEYSDEREAMKKDVTAQDAHFDALLKAVRAGTSFISYTRARFVQEFGDPVLTKLIERQNKKQERALYRHQSGKQGAKVYVFFDENGALDGLELVEQ